LARIASFAGPPLSLPFFSCPALIRDLVIYNFTERAAVKPHRVYTAAPH